MGPLHPATAEQLAATVAAALGEKARRVSVALGELTVVVAAPDYLAAALILLVHAVADLQRTRSIVFWIDRKSVV